MDSPNLIKTEKGESLKRWDSDDQLLEDHTFTPVTPIMKPNDFDLVGESKPSNTVQALEQEVENLKDMVTRQGSIIQRLCDQLVTTPPRPVVGYTKPKDIPIQQLQELQGLNSTTTLQIFFELVEQCSEEDQRRVQIAKGRVSSELPALIHNRQSSYQCRTWQELKLLLKTEFSTDVNFDRAWKETNTSYYDWADPPQAFTNQLMSVCCSRDTFSERKITKSRQNH